MLTRPESGAHRMLKRAWIWLVILTTILFLYPFEYRATRFLFASGITAVYWSAVFLWWRVIPVRIVLLLVGILPLLALALPGRPVDAKLLASDYARSLRLFQGTRYVWGGESFLGIDCSGLVRKGLFWGLLKHGLCTLNGQPIRHAWELWWHDSSALALKDGYRGWTSPLFTHASIDSADHARLKTGDMAVTDDGVHIMAYLGNHRWIEADPDHGKTIEVDLPTANHWFKVPVVFIRWRWLE